MFISPLGPGSVRLLLVTLLHVGLNLDIQSHEQHSLFLESQITGSDKKKNSHEMNLAIAIIMQRYVQLSPFTQMSLIWVRSS